MDSLSGNSIPKVSSSKKDLIASRGKADKIALKEKYSFEKPNKITGIQELDQILFEQNDIRLDILGSLQFAGVKKNLHKNFLDSLENFAPETAYENTSKALQIWLKKNLLGTSLTTKEEALMEPFKKDLSVLDVGSGIGIFLYEMKKKNWICNGLEMDERYIYFSNKYLKIKVEIEILYVY